MSVFTSTFTFNMRGKILIRNGSWDMAAGMDSHHGPGNNTNF
jgi:hypothetical protein